MSTIIKKVIIFGSSGNTGLATTGAALKAGYEVTAFVRDKAKLEQVVPHNIIEGDVLDKEKVSEAIKDQDGVIIVLGTRNDLSPTTVMSEGTKNIIEAMVTHNVKRVTCCISYMIVHHMMIQLNKNRMYQAYNLGLEPIHSKSDQSPGLTDQLWNSSSSTASFHKWFGCYK